MVDSVSQGWLLQIYLPFLMAIPVQEWLRLMQLFVPLMALAAFAYVLKLSIGFMAANLLFGTASHP